MSLLIAIVIHLLVAGAVIYIVRLLVPALGLPPVIVTVVTVIVVIALLIWFLQLLPSIVSTVPTVDVD